MLMVPCKLFVISGMKSVSKNDRQKLNVKEAQLQIGTKYDIIRLYDLQGSIEVLCC